MKFVLVFLWVTVAFVKCYSQTNEELLILATAYHKYHAWSVDTRVFEELDRIKSPELLKCKDFISELIKKDNAILSNRYLRKPDYLTLRLFYVIVQVNYNMFRENPEKNEIVINRYLSRDIDFNELLAN